MGEMTRSDEAELRAALNTAIAIGPRCGSESLFHVIQWRRGGMSLSEIASRVGITKGAVWSALRKADAALSRHGEGKP